MKILLTGLSTLTVTTTIGSLGINLNNEIKTTNILNNSPTKYDGENKIITNWDVNYKFLITFIYIKSDTLNNWFKLSFLPDLEQLREKIYQDISQFSYQDNSGPKTNLYKLSEKLTNEFLSLTNIRGYNTYGIIVAYHELYKTILHITPQFSPKSNNKNIIEKYFKLTYDTLKVAISRYEWQNIVASNKNKTKIFNIISKFPEWDASGWKGYIAKDDLNILVDKIINNFNQLKTKFENSCTGWKLATNTIGSWVEIEQE